MARTLATTALVAVLLSGCAPPARPWVVAPPAEPSGDETLQLNVWFDDGGDGNQLLAQFMDEAAERSAVAVSRLAVVHTMVVDGKTVWCATRIGPASEIAAFCQRNHCEAPSDDPVLAGLREVVKAPPASVHCADKQETSAESSGQDRPRAETVIVHRPRFGPARQVTVQGDHAMARLQCGVYGGGWARPRYEYERRHHYSPPSLKWLRAREPLVESPPLCGTGVDPGPKRNVVTGLMHVGR